MAQIINITSEALQATIRRLLPSQQGFGEDLQASNVITPIIDLTPTAEGSALDTDLARAISHGGITTFSHNNGTLTLANSPGFWKVRVGISLLGNQANGPRFELNVTDGTTSKIIDGVEKATNTSFSEFFVLFRDYTVFLASGESITAVSTASTCQLYGSYYQVADVNGEIINPSGFVQQ